jgi:hypothetical protein
MKWYSNLIKFYPVRYLPLVSVWVFLRFAQAQNAKSRQNLRPGGFLTDSEN